MSLVFFFDGKHSFQFSEVLEHGYAALSNGINCSAFSDGSLFNKFFLDQKTQVFSKNGTVDVSLVHNMRKLQRTLTSKNEKNIHVHFKLGPSQTQHSLPFQASQLIAPCSTRSICFQKP